MNNFLIITLSLVLVLTGCKYGDKSKEEEPLRFEKVQIADSLKHLWAHCPADLTGDGLADLVYIMNNSAGGYLAYREGQKDPGTWKEYMIAKAPPDSGLFAAGDMECGDMDGDGDIDVIAVRHPGEWVNAGAPADLFWYENPEWKAHYIGRVPDAVKDVSVAHFDEDGKTDLAVMTFESSTLSIFKQKDSGVFERVQYWEYFMNLHEGMDAGDVNGDGWNDIVAGAVIFVNPAENISYEWGINNLDKKWNDQTGDWSRNATKTFLEDIDKDGRMEIFISHSERGGYPLSFYRLDEEGRYIENIICDSIAACHTLQVYDFNLDGVLDVLAGVNNHRAVNLGKTDYNVTIFLGNDGYKPWIPVVIDSKGIYNGQAIDFDSDGDMDIFRYPGHEATEYLLLINKVIE